MGREAASGRDVTGRSLVLSAPRFVGRAGELAALTGALATPPALVLVEGEAGIGKSRLVQEFLGSPAGAGHRALVAACPPFRQPHTLGPVAEALRQAVGEVAPLGLSPLAGALRPLFPEWAAGLPPALEPAEDGSAARHRVFRALAEVLDCLAVDALVAEDVHWADEATLEFLLYLASRQPQRVSLVLTYRPEDVPAGSLLLRLASRPAAGEARLRLALRPLDIAATAGLVSSMLTDQHVSQEFAAFVHERTEGVPLAVEESVRLMGERASLARRGGEWVRRPLSDIDVPPTIRDSVLERVSRFSAQAQAVLRAAAVLAEPASEPLLTAVSGLTPQASRAGLGVALDAGLLAENGRGLVSFRHVLAARAVYEAIAAPERRAMHREAAAGLERAPSPAVAELARHFREAGEMERWRAYGEESVELALAAGDETTAAVLLSELIEQADLPVPAATRLLDKIVFASLIDAGRHEAGLVRALRGRLASGRLTPGEEGAVRFQLGRMLRIMEDHEATRAELELAVPLLEGDPARAARAMTILGWSHDADSPAGVYLGWLRRAATLAGSLDHFSAQRLLVDRVTALLILGEAEGWADAARLPSDAPTAQERKLITLGHLNVGDLAVMWGRYDEAQQRLSTALALAQAHHYQRYRQVILVNQAHLDWFTGRWDGLRERVRALAEAEEGPLPRIEAVLVSGLLDAAAGAHEQAAEQFRAILAARKQRLYPVHAMEPAAALAWLELAAGRPAAALEVTEEPVTVAAGKDTWLWAVDVAPARVAALVAAGRAGEAAELAGAFAAGIRDRGIPSAEAALLLAQAILAEEREGPASGAAGYARAAAAWQALPRPFDAMLARERQARCLIAAGQEEAGVGLLQQVADELTELGARGDALRVIRTLRQQGAVVKLPGAGRPGYGDRLSPREAEVARLLVGGRTNREIAERLYLSPKTVARHIESAMRKLNVTTRTALAVRVMETGAAGGNADSGPR